MLNCKYLFSNYLSTESFYVLSITLLAIFIFVVFSVYKTKFFRVVGILIVVGGFSNIVERIQTGCVYDPFNFYGLFHFNYADILITLGSGLLMYRLFVKDEKL